jgi:hypothetical protein
MRRSSFTLIEVITTLGLFSMMAALLIGWFCSLQKLEFKIESERIESHMQLTSFRRINKLLESARQEEFILFFTDYETYATPNSSPFLIFHFDHGVQEDPFFSGRLIGKLYHNPQKESLDFLFWPLPTENHSFERIARNVTVIENVKRMDFSFYSSPDHSKPVNPHEVGNTQPREGWQSEWKESYEKLPALVKLKVDRTQKKKSFEMTFDLKASVFMEELI